MRRIEGNFREIEDVVILYPDNYINGIEGDRLDEMCDFFLLKGVKKFLIDFSGTELINSIGISIMIGIMEKVRERDGMLLFSGLKKVNTDIFGMVGLTKFVQVFGTEKEAMEELLSRQTYERPPMERAADSGGSDGAGDTDL